MSERLHPGATNLAAAEALGSFYYRNMKAAEMAAVGAEPDQPVEAASTPEPAQPPAETYAITGKEADGRIRAVRQYSGGEGFRLDLAETAILEESHKEPQEAMVETENGMLPVWIENGQITIYNLHALEAFSKNATPEALVTSEEHMVYTYQENENMPEVVLGQRWQSAVNSQGAVKAVSVLYRVPADTFSTEELAQLEANLQKTPQDLFQAKRDYALKLVEYNAQQLEQALAQGNVGQTVQGEDEADTEVKRAPSAAKNSPPVLIVKRHGGKKLPSGRTEAILPRAVKKITAKK